ncbi:TetR family transcriptional regulator [Actinoplanes sp. NPDC051470]|uniref:TetR/AcrR family transcriptional regulator n=1 Tax=unclassified Actinoplanes TaxID=2626549 RepID=UPI00341CBFEA
MPRKVDHQERRTLIADALTRLAAEQGLEAVSLRHVAAEAGVSAGMVQHYFRTRDEMMTFAMEVVRDRTQARVSAAVVALGDDPAARDLLRTTIAALLPLDDDARDLGRVALAFLAYTAVRPSLRTPLRAETAQLTEHFAGLLPGRNGEGAAGLVAMMEGLGLYLLGGQLTPEQATQALDAQLDLLFSDR